MKLSLVIFLVSAMALTGCNSKSDKENNNSGANSGKVGAGPSDLSDLVLSDFALLRDVNFQDAEKENYVLKTESGDVQKTKFFYTIQDKRIVVSKEVDKSLARCELSISKNANETIDDVFLKEQKLDSPSSFRFDSESSETNGAGTSKASLRLRLAVESAAFGGRIEMLPLDINCWQVTTQAELSKQIGSYLSFKKREADKK